MSTAIGEDAYAYDLIAQPDGKSVAAKARTVSFDSAFALTLYNPNGSLDRTFGDGGTVTTGFEGDVQPKDLVEQPDGKLVAAGWTGTRDANSRDTYRFAQARYLR